MGDVVAAMPCGTATRIVTPAENEERQCWQGSQAAGIALIATVLACVRRIKNRIGTMIRRRLLPWSAVARKRQLHRGRRLELGVAAGREAPAIASEASLGQLGRDVLPVAVAIADPPAMGTFPGQIAHHGLPVDEGGHECPGCVAARLAGLAGVRDLRGGHTLQPHVDASDDNRITVQHVRPPDQALGRDSWQGDERHQDPQIGRKVTGYRIGFWWHGLSR